MLITSKGLAYPLYNAFIPFIIATKGADFGDGMSRMGRFDDSRSRLQQGQRISHTETA